MDDWDKAARGVVGGLDDAAKNVIGGQSDGLRNTLYDALMSNPDMTARAVKLGRETGMSPDLVERNLPDVERESKLKKLSDLPKRNPLLSDWLENPGNAKLAHDDLDTLDLISQATMIRPPAVPKLSESYGFSQASRDLRTAQNRNEKALSQYVSKNMPTSEISGRERTLTEGLTEPFMRGLARGRRGITLLMGMGGVYDGAEAELGVRLAQQNRQAEAYPVPESVQQGSQAISDAEGFADAAWAILTNPGAVKETVIESMGISAPSLLAAGTLSVLGPGGTAAGAGMGSFAVEYGATIQDVLNENGVNASDPMAIIAALGDQNIMDAAREKALARGVPIAMFDALTAGFAGKLLKGAKNTKGSAAARTAGELGIQAGGGGAGEATAQYMADEFKPGEILLEAIAEMPTGLIEIPANYQHARAKAERADVNAKAIEELNTLAKSAKVLQRDPETFQSFIAAATEEGPVQNVFLDGKTLMQSGMAPSIAELSPSVRDQLDRSVISGGMISIPVDEYATTIAPTEFAPQLLDMLKTEPEGFSRAEAADYMANAGAELQAEVERVIGSQADADTFRASQDVVKQDILGQLNTAGRFTPQVNEAYATLASSYAAVRASQLGMTPEAFHAERGMRVQGAAVAGQQFSQSFDGSNDSFFTKGLADGLPADAEFVSELTKTRTFKEFGLRGFDVPSQRVVMSRVLGVLQDDKVRQSIVELVPVEVVDILRAEQLTPEMLFNDMAMLSDLLAVDGDKSVPFSVDASRVLVDRITSLVAEHAPGRLDGGLGSGDRFAASVAGAGNDLTDGLDVAGVAAEDLAALADVGRVTGDSGSAGGAGVGAQGDSPSTGYRIVYDRNTGLSTIETFDPADPNILNQSQGTGPRASFSPGTNTIALLNNADLTSFLHESAHYFFENDIALASELVQKPELSEGEQRVVDDVSALLSWHGIHGDINEQLRTWHTMDFEEQRSHHERTAESFEAYLFSGTAPSLELQPIFQRFRSWMINVYKSLKAFIERNPEAGKLSDEVRSVFDRMIATDEQIQLAEQARSLTALFSSPETSGMTPEAFAAYQALGVDATNEAIQELQAKGLRDMQWLAGVRGRAVKRLQKESKAALAEVTIEARREVLTQPVYQAWEFLTRKLSENDKLPPLERKSDQDMLDPSLDSLFVAIAKLGGIKKDQVLAEWGIDPKDTPQSGLFGKPVWRLTDGLSLDGMAAALAEYGYLPLNEHGQYELNDLGDRFIEELAGNTQFSNVYEPQDLQPGEQISNPSGLLAGRFDSAGLASLGIPDEIIGHLQALKMTSDNGLHPDQVAELFGFSSGDDLARTLAAAQTPKDAISAMAEKMMLERFGELSSPDAIESAADQAIHNDVRARMLATEVNALAKAIGKPKVLASAAKAFAADMIARLKVRDVRPGQYANAEAKAAKAADKAHKAGDTALAASEKRNQIIQHYATRAAYDALDEVKIGIRYLKKFDKRSKTIDPEYQDQIEAMLERFELRSLSNKAVDKRTSLAQWLTAQREAGIDPDIDPAIENEAFRTSYKNITIEEFRGLVDAIKQIEHMGRLKNRLMTSKDKREFKVIVEEVASSIEENGGKARKINLETPKGIRPWLEGVAAGHRKMASLIRQMDGLKDGGPFWRVLVRGMNEASTNETVMIEKATVRLTEIYAPMLALNGGVNGDKRLIPEIGDSLTRGGRLSVALNWGNAANRQRILDGDQWTEQQVHAILKTLTHAEWAFVQDVWTFIDSYWPAIEAKEKRVTGRAPDKVTAEPFSYMVDGEMVSMTGGYYPIKYDSNRDDRAEKHDAAAIAQDMMRGAMTRSTTRRGHTKARMESVNRPVKKTLDVITQHVTEVTHDLAWHEWLIDANRLIDAKPINQAIRDYYGAEVLRTMKDALTSIATADIVPLDSIDRGLLYLRANVSRSTMGFSLTTSFLQPFGLLQSMVRIGPKHVLRGMARWAGDATRFESSMTWITEKSEFMRLRDKTFNRELHEIKGRVSHGHSQARQIYDASLFMLMQKMQMVADVPTWIGAYEKALTESQDDATAVALADQAVLDSQGGGQTKDMAQFQKKHPFLTMFYSYFNTTLNLAAESTAKTNFKNPLALAGWASDMALLMVIPALGPAILLSLMKGDDCGDPEECAVKLARAQAGYMMNLLIGVREMAGLTSGFDYAGPPVGRVVTELQRTGKQIGQGEADEALTMSSVRLLGVAIGLPTTQILRSYRGWVAWEDGEAPASSILMGPPSKD